MRKSIAAIVVAFVLVLVVVPVADSHTSSPTPSPLLRGVDPPNVVGLKLPIASERLRDAGWVPVPFNTDTLLGIVVPSHYTVCHEYQPIGKRVRILAQKYGC